MTCHQNYSQVDMDIIGNDVFTAKQCVGIVLFWTRSQYLSATICSTRVNWQSIWMENVLLHGQRCLHMQKYYFFKLFYSPHSAGVTATTTTKEN